MVQEYLSIDSKINFINSDTDGCTTVNEKDIILANKGVEAFNKLENIIEAIYKSDLEQLEKLIKNIHEENEGCLK